MGQEARPEIHKKIQKKQGYGPEEPACGGRKVCHNWDAIEYLLTRHITLSTTCQQGWESVGGLMVGSQAGKGKKNKNERQKKKNTS